METFYKKAVHVDARCAVALYTAALLAASVLGFAPASAEPSITLSPPEGLAGTQVTVDGSGFLPASLITIEFDGGNMHTRPPTLIASGLGSFSATFEVPHSIDPGSYSVVAKGHDALGVTTVSATSNFTVIVPNKPPVAESQSLTTPHATEAQISLRGSDPDGDTITFSIADSPAHGTINSFDANAGTLGYRPADDYTGKDRFTFKVNDGHADSFLGEVSINVLAADSGPRMPDSKVEVEEDGQVSILLKASDNDGSALRFRIVDPPSHGSLGEIRPYSSDSVYVTYTPNHDFNGTDSFTATASDTRSESEPGTVSISVTPVQDPPVATGAEFSAKQGEIIEMPLAASDPDGDTLTYSIVSQPSRGKLLGSMPDLQYVAPADYLGWDSFTFTVNDGHEDSSPAKVEVQVVQAQVPQPNPDDGQGGVSGGGNSGEPSTAGGQPTGAPTGTPQVPDEPSGDTQIPPVAEPSQPAEPDVPSPPPQGSDTVPPRLIFPSSTLVFDSQSAAGTTVNYNIAAIDDADGQIEPVCSPASGSVFPVGKVNVVCTAKDSAGNSALGSFEVEVRFAGNLQEAKNPLTQLPDLKAIPNVDPTLSIAIIVAAVAGIIAAVVAAKKARAKKPESAPPALPSPPSHDGDYDSDG